MRNTFTTLSLAALLAFPLCGNAQQLPNNGFDNEWVPCVPWTSANNEIQQGTTPASWCVSNVYAGTGVISAGNKSDIGTPVDGGYNNSKYAVKLKNSAEILGQVVPAYITLGKSWSTSYLVVISPNGKDGGSFGGIEFNYRPDAVSFMYKRNAPNENSSVVAYLWKGTFSQNDVPGNIASKKANLVKTTMVDRDRNVLGMEYSQGGDVTQKGTLIASLSKTFNTGSADEWSSYIADFEYKTDDTPEKINVIISAGDYFSDSPKGNSELIIDDVKLIYYSRLKDLQVNGTTIDGFASDKYEYAVDAAMPEESAFSFATLGTSGSAKAAVAIDTENAKATITVNNVGEDADGQTSHVYTVQYKKESSETPDVPSDVYDGGLDIEIGGESMSDEPIPAKVYVKYTGDDICTVSLPDFTLDGVHKVDIVVPNVTVSHDGDKVCFEGVATGLSLDLGLGEPVKASASLSPADCYIDADGKAYLKIVVTWHSEDGDMPINVIFNGQGPKPSAIEGVDVDNSNAPVEFYNLQGIRVNSSDMAPGIYIRRQGTDVKKVLVK